MAPLERSHILGFHPGGSADHVKKRLQLAPGRHIAWSVVRAPPLPGNGGLELWPTCRRGPHAQEEPRLSFVVPTRERILPDLRSFQNAWVDGEQRRDFQVRRRRGADSWRALQEFAQDATERPHVDGARVSSPRHDHLFAKMRSSCCWQIAKQVTTSSL